MSDRNPLGDYIRSEVEALRQRAEHAEARLATYEAALRAYQEFRAWYYAAGPDELVRDLAERRATIDQQIDAALIPPGAIDDAGPRSSGVAHCKAPQ